MMPRKDDRRIQRTRKLLRESMLALILEKGYDDINIQDVTDHANLGRATFYLHYKEKDDLLADVIHQLFDDFLVTAPHALDNQWNLKDIKGIQKLFEFAESHYDLYRIMMIGKGSITSSRQLHTILRESISTSLDRELTALGMQITLPHDFLESYLAGSLQALVFWWLDNDMPYTPAEMARMYQQINSKNRTDLLCPPDTADSPNPVVPVSETKNDKKTRQAKPAPENCPPNKSDSAPKSATALASSDPSHPSDAQKEE
ncbi:MAG: TetR/AcrR family transcriptional regulator [Anaerolineaceae bacterium]